MIEAIGWTSSLILLATLVKQIAKQWRDGAKGVSKWLFIGQVAASLGFVVYSVFKHDRIFAVTNSLILLSAIVGVVTWWRTGRGGTNDTRDARGDGTEREEEVARHSSVARARASGDASQRASRSRGS